MAETLIGTKEVRSIMTKSNLPVGGYSVNPYVGCTHACKYCYASFMKRFTGHKRRMGHFLRREALACDQESEEICRTASGYWFSDRWV